MRLLVSPTSATPPPDLNSGPLLDPRLHPYPIPSSYNRGFTTRMFDSDTYFKGSGVNGLGQSTATTAVAIAGAGAITTTSILAALSGSSGSNNSSGGSSGSGSMSTAGIVGLAINGIIAITQLLIKLFSGCGQTCTQATTYANQVEPILNQNLQAYLSSPIRTVSMQAAAINNYNTAIASLEQACGQAALAQAGVNCIDERVNASSCQWKAQAGGWVQNADGTCTYTPWGASGSGSSCWNWVIGYLDPIQNDPCVQPDSVLTSSAGTTDTSTSSLTNLLNGSSSDLLSSTVTVGTLSIPTWVLLAGGAALLLTLK